jgi:hypothetical protein
MKPRIRSNLLLLTFALSIMGYGAYQLAVPQTAAASACCTFSSDCGLDQMCCWVRDKCEDGAGTTNYGWCKATGGSCT